ncbi:MAG: zinc metallopeptidase [Candidatus Omnitrophica bacterium]|nr:zinc metallopeptidase [Candidatus Omnitrophota bacterium]
MGLIHGVFFVGTVGVSFGFALYSGWIFWKYGRSRFPGSVTGCEIARYVLDQAGLPQIGVAPLPSSGEYPASEGLFIEPWAYQGTDPLSVLRAARQAFLKGQLSNMTFWVRLKRRVAFVVKLAVFCGWALLLSGQFVPGLSFLTDMGLGCFATVMLLVLFDLPVELEIKDRTVALLQKSGHFQPLERVRLRKLARAVAFKGLAALVNVPLIPCCGGGARFGSAYGI